MSSILTTLFVLCLSLTLSAQDCSGLKNETPTNSFELVATSSQKLSSRSTKAVDAARESMKKELLVKVSEKIIIEVESGSVNFVQDDGNAITQLFTSETKINSNTRLGNLRFEFCFSKKNKTLFGRCRLDKTGLAESIAKDCISRLIALNAEISGLKNSGNSVNVRPLERKYAAITRDFQTALFINHQIPTQEWNLHVADYNKSLGSIANSDGNLDINFSLNQADDYMAKDQYDEALVLLKGLKKRHNQNDDIEHSLRKCYDRYLAHVKLQSSRLIQQHDYAKAIELVDIYCSDAICSSEAKSLREDLRKDYFNASSDMLTASMRAKDDNQAAAQYTTLSRLADIRPEQFKDLSERYQKYKVDRLIEKARIENDKRNYWEAYSLLRTTEMTYGVENGELKSLKESLFRKIAAQEIREEKKTKPHRNSFQFGPEVLSNEVRLSDASSFGLNYMHLAFGAGLYFKYNFGESNTRKGYPVNSDLIGIKARYVDLPSYVAFSDSVSNTNIPGSGHIAELGADGVLVRIFHYNISAVYNESSRFGEPMGMSASFGIRIPIARVAFGVDGRYFNKFNDYTSVSAVAYIHGKMDFNRIFRRADKREVRARLRDF